MSQRLSEQITCKVKKVRYDIPEDASYLHPVLKEKENLPLFLKEKENLPLFLNMHALPQDTFHPVDL